MRYISNTISVLPVIYITSKNYFNAIKVNKKMRIIQHRAKIMSTLAIETNVNENKCPKSFIIENIHTEANGHITF